MVNSSIYSGVWVDGDDEGVMVVLTIGTALYSSAQATSITIRVASIISLLETTSYEFYKLQ